jgi:ABC-2 type transport system permease protein
MTPLLAYYRAHSRVTLATELQYRASLLIWQIAAVLEPTVFLVVWSAAARASGGAVGGYTPADFAAYYLTLLVVNRLTSTFTMWVFEWFIREGQLSAMLLRPLHPIHGIVAEMATHNLVSFVLLLPAIAALALIFRPAFHAQPWSVAAFPLALILAFAARFLLEWTLSLAAFWTTRVAALNQLYFTAFLCFSGLLAPLALFPQPIQTLAALLPFRALVAFPIDLLLGRLTPAGAPFGFAAQLAWLGVALALQHVIWRSGLRRYAAVGA